jgi:Na+-driven multidrug efflux pump
MAVTLVTNLALYPLLPLLVLWLGLHGAGLHALFQNVIATAMLIFFFAKDARDPPPRPVS